MPAESGRVRAAVLFFCYSDASLPTFFHRTVLCKYRKNGLIRQVVDPRNQKATQVRGLSISA